MVLFDVVDNLGWYFSFHIGWVRFSMRKLDLHHRTRVRDRDK